MNTRISLGITTFSGLLLIYCLYFLFQKAVATTALLPKSYHLVKQIALGGKGGWDYLTLDSSARRLYITHATQVTVLDVDTGLVVGAVPHTLGVHGVAIAPELGRGFTSNGMTSTATIFELKTLRVLGQVKTGSNPDAIIYDPFSGQVFTFNGKSNSATVFNAKTAKVLGDIQLGGQPEFAVSDGLGRIYVNLEDKSQLLTLNANRRTIQARSSLAPCSEPTGMSMDRQHRLLFIGCRNQMMAIVEWH